MLFQNLLKRVVSNNTGFKLVLLWCLTWLCLSSFHFPYEHSHAFVLKTGYAANRSDASVSVTFDEIGLEYRNIQTMLEDIRNANSSGSQAENAWKYVIENSFHCTPVTQGNWLHHPEVFINSVGFGLCDDQASVLAALWNALGFESRIWDLNGKHVIAEVNDGTEWKVYDPDLHCFFTKKDNSVASYRNLISNTPLVYKSYHLRRTIQYLLEDDNCNPQVKEAYSDDMRVFYRTDKDNSNITLQQLSYQKNISEKIVLPQLSELNFMQSNYFHIDDGLPVKNFIKITLLPGAKGILYLPLMPLGCKGNFRFEKSEQQFSVSGVFAFNYESFLIDSFIVTEVKDTSVIYFLANGIKTTGAYANCQQFAYEDLKPVMKQMKHLGRDDRLEAFLGIQEIPDTLFSKLRNFTCYLDSLHPKMNSQNDFGKVYFDFEKMVYLREPRDKSVYKNFLNDFFNNDKGHKPKGKAPINWNIITVLCYAISNQ